VRRRGKKAWGQKHSAAQGGSGAKKPKKKKKSRTISGAASAQNHRTEHRESVRHACRRTAVQMGLQKKKKGHGEMVLGPTTGQTQGGTGDLAGWPPSLLAGNGEGVWRTQAEKKKGKKNAGGCLCKELPRIDVSLDKGGGKNPFCVGQTRGGGGKSVPTCGSRNAAHTSVGQNSFRRKTVMEGHSKKSLQGNKRGGKQ